MKNVGRLFRKRNHLDLIFIHHLLRFLEKLRSAQLALVRKFAGTHLYVMALTFLSLKIHMASTRQALVLTGLVKFIVQGGTAN